MRHPDLIDLAVCGIKDRDWGQRVVAVAVLRPDHKPGQDSLAAFARAHLSPEELPKEWHIVAALPRDGFGKLRRKSLAALVVAGREMAADKAGASLPEGTVFPRDEPSDR